MTRLIEYSGTKIVMYTDGGARGNPGPSGVGIRLEDSNGNLIKEGSKYIGEQTNNYAEYEAVYLGLMGIKKLFDEQVTELEIDAKLDSELVVKQLNGEYKVKHPNIKGQYDKTMHAAHMFKTITFTHVLRENNAHADRLANEAMDRGE